MCMWARQRKSDANASSRATRQHITNLNKRLSLLMQHTHSDSVQHSTIPGIDRLKLDRLLTIMFRKLRDENLIYDSVCNLGLVWWWMCMRVQQGKSEGVVSRCLFTRYLTIHREPRETAPCLCEKLWVIVNSMKLKWTCATNCLQGHIGGRECIMVRICKCRGKPNRLCWCRNSLAWRKTWYVSSTRL